MGEGESRRHCLPTRDCCCCVAVLRRCGRLESAGGLTRCSLLGEPDIVNEETHLFFMVTAVGISLAAVVIPGWNWNPSGHLNWLHQMATARKRELRQECSAPGQRSDGG